MFLGFYGYARPRWHSLPYPIDMLRALRAWRRRDRRGATVIVRSRDGSIKHFDFEDMTVSTRVSEPVMRNLIRARTSDLFTFFETPEFTFQPSHDGMFLKREQLFEFPCIGSRTDEEQRRAVRSIATSSVRYLRSSAQSPDPVRFMGCFDEVAGCLDPERRARLEAKRQDFEKFVHAAQLVETHLDFNVANFIGNEDERLLLLDIADTGLVLPGTYDVNNLLLNEVYRGRSAHLLRSALERPASVGCGELVNATIGRGSTADFRTSIVVNFVLRESSLVAVPLHGSWDPRRIITSWDRFTAAIPGWPFDGLARDQDETADATGANDKEHRPR